VPAACRASLCLLVGRLLLAMCMQFVVIPRYAAPPACRRKLIPGFKRKSFKAESLEVRQQKSKMDATMTDFQEWFPT